MLLTLIAIVSQSVFPGGNANEFAESLSKSTGQNVVFAQSKVNDIPNVAYPADNLNEISKVLRSKANIHITPGADLILHDGLIPEIRIADFEPATWPIAWRGMKASELSNGKVTVSTEGKDRIDLELLTDFGFSKPLKVHWFYNQIPVSAWVKDMPEADFLRYAAKAVGARFVDSAKEYRIDFDADEVRNRALKLLNSWPEKKLEGQVDGMDSPKDVWNMLKATLAEIPKANLEAAFATQESKAKFPIAPNGKVAQNMRTALGKIAKENTQGEQVVRTPVGELGPSFFFDGKSRLEATLSATFIVRVSFFRYSPEQKSDFELSLDFRRLGG